MSLISVSRKNPNDHLFPTVPAFINIRKSCAYSPSTNEWLWFSSFMKVDYFSVNWAQNCDVNVSIQVSSAQGGFAVDPQTRAQHHHPQHTELKTAPHHAGCVEPQCRWVIYTETASAFWVTWVGRLVLEGTVSERYLWYASVGFPMGRKKEKWRNSPAQSHFCHPWWNVDSFCRLQ